MVSKFLPDTGILSEIPRARNANVIFLPERFHLRLRVTDEGGVLKEMSFFLKLNHLGR